MRTSRRRVGAVALLFSVATGIGPTAAAQAATTQVPTGTLTINGSAPGATPIPVSGTPDIEVTITPVPGSPIKDLRYALGSATGSVLVQPGQCSSTCTVPVPIDTTALRPLTPGGAGIPKVRDGFNYLVVSIDSAAGMGSVQGQVNVDNHRPVADPTFRRPLVHANSPLSWTVHPTVSATAPAGTTITDVQSEIPGSPALPVTHFARNADGSWTVNADTGSLPTGVYTSVAVAVDSDGTDSPPVIQPFSVDHGFTLDAPAQLTTGPNGKLLGNLAYGYHGWYGCAGSQDLGDGAPVSLEMKIDGTVWQDFPVDASRVSALGGGLCELPATGDGRTPPKPLPLGRHTFTWVVTDSFGVKETVSAPVTVALPLTSDLSVLDRNVVAGDTLRVKPSISAPDGFSKIASWSFLVNGAQVASGAGATQPSLALATPLARETGGTVALELVSDSGLVTYQSFTYQTGWATAAYMHVSATSVRRGATVSFYASDWERIAGTWRFEPRAWALMQYQWSVPGSQVWHNGQASILSPANPRPPVLQARIHTSLCFRAAYSQNQDVTAFGDANIPTTSTPVCVRVH